MNKKQYNNVIENTLKYEQSAQTDDSLSTARAIFNNMGVALPQGDIKTVYETISTNNYMGWKSCTMQEAQAAADRGVAAIGISEDKIVVLSANDQEQPVTQTASVMTLDENTSAYAVEGMRYYSYSYGTTSETIVVPRKFNNNYLINQGNSTITYPEGEQPGSENRAFWDELFYGTVCGKTGATGNIQEFGCAICTLAMFLLYKGNKINANDNVYYAVKAATIQATDIEADFLGNSTEISYNNGSAQVTASIIRTNYPEYYLEKGRFCIFRIQQGEVKSHYVLVYDMDASKTGTDRYLVADADGGKMRTLTEAIQRKGLPANMSYITEMYSIT